MGGNKEILKNLKTGFLYEPGEIERAAEIIHSIKNNNPKKPVADKNKDKYLKKFDFRYILKQHEQLYDRLLFKH
jgi:glycosyltransferase involved in cell wall biosynthesis